MKLVLVGPGIMPIPPSGWGAVEILIWDLKCFIEKLYGDDIEVHIVNTPDMNKIVTDVNTIHPDVVHIHYDVFGCLYDKFNCKNVLLASQYGYLDSGNWFHGYYSIFNTFVNSTKSGTYIHCVSDKIYTVYKNAGVSDDRLFIMPNGANNELFRYTDTPPMRHKSIYLGKIEPRKRQCVYQDIECMDFVGNHCDANFKTQRPNYIGPWTKNQLYENLTNYGNLVLLSDGEAHPLVVCEALISGLGVVVSEAASANLDRSLPFITVVPNDKLDNTDYVTAEICRNREISITQRRVIREYGLNAFSYSSIVARYVAFLKSVVTNCDVFT